MAERQLAELGDSYRFGRPGSLVRLRTCTGGTDRGFCGAGLGLAFKLTPIVRETAAADGVGYLGIWGSLIKGAWLASCVREAREETIPLRACPVVGMRMSAGRMSCEEERVVSLP